jgi:hypothetical protein
MPIRHQHHRRIAMSPAVLPGRIHQALDFGLRQVLAGAQLAVREALSGNCSIYGGWGD